MFGELSLRLPEERISRKQKLQPLAKLRFSIANNHRLNAELKCLAPPNRLLTVNV
jgi:hypothetical protein